MGVPQPRIERLKILKSGLSHIPVSSKSNDKSIGCGRPAFGTGSALAGTTLSLTWAMPDIAINPEVLRQRRFKRRAVVVIPAGLLAALAIWALTRPAAGPAVQRSDL
jgi:hypothetical protein